jgi:hypothetical protein
MKRLVQILGLTPSKKPKRKTLSELQHERLIQQGKEQFRKLIEKGLNVPVAYL